MALQTSSRLWLRIQFMPVFVGCFPRQSHNSCVRKTTLVTGRHTDWLQGVTARIYSFEWIDPLISTLMISYNTAEIIIILWYTAGTEVLDLMFLQHSWDHHHHVIYSRYWSPWLNIPTTQLRLSSSCDIQQVLKALT